MNRATSPLREEVAEVTRETKYERQISAGLEKAYGRALELEEQEAPPVLDIESARYIIFSDQHKGARNLADDFRLCERSYNAALAYYYAKGFTLVELGDVEELWEERSRAVLKEYRYTLDWTARFHQERRYLRFWGNHDDHWSFSDRVNFHLAPIYGGDLKVYEARRIRVLQGSRELGFLFLLHGHQGTSDSDKFGWLSRIPVRFVWRPIQRVFRVSPNTPAKEWVLRERHNIAMYRWATKKEKHVVIAGHTHRPVFKSKTHAKKLEEEVEAARRKLDADPSNPELIEKLAEASAHLEWVRSEGLQEKGPEGEVPVEMEIPCYFNAGCCCFLDGDVTGIEIQQGEVRLVRWPDDEDRPKPRYLETMRLEDLFRSLG